VATFLLEGLGKKANDLNCLLSERHIPDHILRITTQDLELDTEPGEIPTRLSQPSKGISICTEAQ
jgi:hypothetical protein